MSVFNFQNPSGASDTFPFPTDGTRKIYYQEVNNVLAQIRDHINGSLGPDNFELPFQTEIDWNIAGNGGAIDVASVSTARAVNISHDTNQLNADVGLVQITSLATNSLANSSLLRVFSNDAASPAWPVHILSAKGSGDVRFLRLTNDIATVDYWQLYKTDADELVQNIPAANSYDLQIDDVSHLAISETSIELKIATNVTGDLSVDGLASATGDISSDTSFTRGSTILTDGQLTFGDTAVISKEGTDTILLADRVRIGTAAGPRISSLGGNVGLIESAVALGSVANNIRISKGGDDNILLVKDSNSGNDRAVVVGSNDTQSFKIYRARVNTVTGAVVSSNSDVVSLGLVAATPGKVRLRISNIASGGAGTQVATAPIVIATMFHNAGADTLANGKSAYSQVLNATLSGDQFEFTLWSIKGNDENGVIRAETDLYWDVCIIAVRGD